ncbi:MAG: capsular biosynthesis protein [Gammaproteobacteria bacterium]|nr:MAG: capsular biosynthesis protein [Gammaproteobacteria bacterium]
MKVLVTGSSGFIGKNVCKRLQEQDGFEVVEFRHQNTLEELSERLTQVDFVIHLAGINRPKSSEEFRSGNVELTRYICECLSKGNSRVPILFSSSTQADQDNPYGESKRKAEEILRSYSENAGGIVGLLRLPNVFGKWARPNYNSVVATFCHNIANDETIEIHNPNTRLTLVYVDDVVEQVLGFITEVQAQINEKPYCRFLSVQPIYEIELQVLADTIRRYHHGRKRNTLYSVGRGLDRALYATYLSYLKPDSWVHRLVVNRDARGTFTELLKNEEAGQFSFFTINPGEVRGGHYHNTKNERFMVIMGKAKYCFQNIVSQEQYSVESTGDNPEVVETIPGWVHDIENVDSAIVVVLLWSNEVFDQNKPDTYIGTIDK